MSMWLLIPRPDSPVEVHPSEIRDAQDLVSALTGKLTK